MSETPPTAPRLTVEQRLTWISDQVETWREYATQPHPVIPGSPQALDDALFDVLPPSHLIWHGISSAIDHLDVFMSVLTSGRSHPLAPSTLARSGILGGAHALWLMDHPDRAERQRRGLRLAREEFHRDRQMLRDLVTLDRELDTDSDGPDAAVGENVGQQQIALRTEWIDRAIKVGGQIGMRATQVTAQLDETSIIDTVARRFAETIPDSQQFAWAYRMMWRLYSGTAHGLRFLRSAQHDFVRRSPGHRAPCQGKSVSHSRSCPRRSQGGN